MHSTDEHPQTCQFPHPAAEGPAPAVTHVLSTGDGRTYAVCEYHARLDGGHYLRTRELATGIDTFTEGVGTDELRTGDVVRFYGARLVIDREITSFPGGHGRTVYATEARIDNWEDMKGYAEEDPGSAAAWIVAQSSELRWSVQGSGLDTWTRERTRHG